MQVTVLIPGDISVAEGFLRAPSLDSLSILELQAMFPVTWSEKERSKERFAQFQLEDVQRNLLKLQEAHLLEVISNEQLTTLDISFLQADGLQELFPVFDEVHLEESKVHFSLLSFFQIQSAFNELRKTNLLELISGPQLAGLDLSILNVSDWECIFPIGDKDSYDYYLPLCKERFSHLTGEQVISNLDKLQEANLLELFSEAQVQSSWAVLKENDLLHRISGSLLRDLDLAPLDKEDLQSLFFPHKRDWSSIEDVKAAAEYAINRFAHILPTTVANMFTEISEANLLNYISGPQLAALDVANLSAEKWQECLMMQEISELEEDNLDLDEKIDDFFKWILKISKERFSHLSPSQIEGGKKTLKEKNLLRLISGPQLAALNLESWSSKDLKLVFFCREGDLSAFKENMSRFAYILPDTVRSMLTKIRQADLLCLISGPQLAALDVGNLSAADWREICPLADEEWDGYKLILDMSRERFACLSPPQVHSSLEKLKGTRLLSLISGEHLAQLDLASFDLEDLQRMFPKSYDSSGFDDADISKESKERFSHLTNSQRSGIWDKIKGTGLMELLGPVVET